MSDSLDVIILDDDHEVCQVLLETIRKFYSWGDVFAFTDPKKAIAHCKARQGGSAIFVLDVFMGNITSFDFLEVISTMFPLAYEDTIIITGAPSDDIVNMCVASNITHLLEKPVKPYALQLAVRTIVARYLRFAKRLLEDTSLAKWVAGL